MTDARSFLDAARALLGPRGLTQDPDLVEPWQTDWRGRYTGSALALASPASTAEAAALVALCAEHRVGIVPQGGNSGMSGGATPDASGGQLLVSLRRMTAIREVDAAARTAVCEAGVILETLHHAAEGQGLRFPLTLGGKGSATVGGLISTNAGGTQVLRHGSMRALVLGIEAVLPDGQVLSQLTPLKKDNRGFDLKQLLIGAEGTLGLVTAATLRLAPALTARRVAWVGLQSLHAARELLLLCQAREDEALEGFEVLPGHCLESVLAFLPSARAPLAEPYPWHALIELVATSSDGAEALGERTETLLGEALERELIADAAIAANEAQADAFWTLRDSIAPAERALGPAVQHDISVPLASVPGFVDAAVNTIESRWPGVRAVAFGHMGDGNVHFHAIAPHGTGPAWQDGEGKVISRFVHDLVTQWQGSISAEHGIGQLKRDELARLGDPAALGVLRAVKQALDPLGIMNPGKLL